MSLRAQLFGIGLLTLALPWAGYRYVQELEGALRNGFEQSLLASATTMAAALELQSFVEPSPREGMRIEDTIYAHSLVMQPELDGDRTDWRSNAYPGRPLGDDGMYWAAVHERTDIFF